MILDSLLVGTMLFTSFAMRTPNVQPNPDDYEFSIGIDNKYFHINRQWERELGEPYTDDLIWAKLDANGVYFKPEYMNKESHKVKYLKIDWRRTWVGATWGFTTRSTNDALDVYETFLSVGTSKEKKFGKWTIKATFDGYLPPDEMGDTKLENFEFEDKFNIEYKLSEKVSIYNMGEVYQIKGSDFYKAKIGINWRL
tara:strand:- start:757 stop:1347 length:591 start_codon:yes stop_codon:yes gene_type:complete